MGTRNLTCVYLDGEYKVAQYCQWDGYPSGQGLDVLKFVRDDMNRIVFEQKLRDLKTLTTEEVQEKWNSVGADDSGWANSEVSESFQKQYSHLHRDCGAEILNIVQESDSLEIQKNLDFALDSLFCEWCYVIDLDKNTLEAYEGFNKTPLEEHERFKFLGGPSNDGHYPVKLKEMWSFNHLPTNEEFLEALKDEEDVAS